MTTRTQGFNCRPIHKGRDYKLRGVRSNIDGRKAQIVTVTDIIGTWKGDTVSQHRNHRFICKTPNGTEYCHVSRSELIELTDAERGIQSTIKTLHSAQ